MPGLQNNYKVQNTCIIGIPEEEERLKGKEELSETIITENLYQATDPGSLENTKRINAKQ